MTFVMEKPRRLNAALNVAPAVVKAMKALGVSWGKGREFPDIKPQNRKKDER